MNSENKKVLLSDKTIIDAFNELGLPFNNEKVKEARVVIDMDIVQSDVLRTAEKNNQSKCLFNSIMEQMQVNIIYLSI